MRLSFTRAPFFSVKITPEARAVPIVADGAIATGGVGHGRLIPLIIVDATNHPSLAEAIKAQSHLPPGDAIIQWGAKNKHSNSIILALDFLRPIVHSVLIEFNIVRQGAIVEHILQSNGLYIQTGEVGDRLKDDLDRPKMLIEVPDTGMRLIWDKLYFDAVVKHARNEGLDRTKARKVAQTVIEKIRDLSKLRMKSNSPPD